MALLQLSFYALVCLSSMVAATTSSGQSGAGGCADYCNALLCPKIIADVVQECGGCGPAASCNPKAKEALVSGPPGTPYAFGLFEFDIFIPEGNTG